MSSTLKRRKKLLLLTVTCVLAEKHRRRKNRSCWICWWLERHSTLGFSHAVVPELMQEDSAEFQSMFRMDMMAFEQLLDMVALQIAKENTVMRMSISPRLPRRNCLLRYVILQQVRPLPLYVVMYTVFQTVPRCWFLKTLSKLCMWHTAYLDN